MRPISNWIKSAFIALVIVLALSEFVPFAIPDRAAELVEDGAGLMVPAQHAAVTEYHGFLLKDHDIDYRVVTGTDLGDINSYAVSRFEDLAGDGRSRTGRGLLLVVDPGQDLVRLEVSHALEGVFPDAFVAYVEQRQMVPFFRQKRVSDGILAATELIVTRAQRAAANAGFQDEAWALASGGAGATARARIGAGAVPAKSAAGPSPAAGRTPAETLAAYFAAMAARNAGPDLDIYTPATRCLLRGWVMTPAQMDNVVKTYRRCSPEPPRLGLGGETAVIRYPIKQRACAPWFFRRSGDGWALDLTMMQSAIRFGRSNAWRFDLGAEHPYLYAFADWTFDSNGFPLKRRR